MCVYVRGGGGGREWGRGVGRGAEKGRVGRGGEGGK